MSKRREKESYKREGKGRKVKRTKEREERKRAGDDDGQANGGRRVEEKGKERGYEKGGEGE